MATTYRPEIDGLRAVAVLPVILFHAHVRGFTGGFVGVDVFFVISGFLISSIVLGELERGEYSIAAFYERRIRRIFPPLFAMFAVCMAVAWSILLPDELTSFADSLLAATLFGSNVGFWSEAGYFDRVAETKPLLHTWSLCVEEQFYLLFPPLLATLHRRFRQAVPYVFFALLLVSFAGGMRVVEEESEAGFYLVQYRAWELLIGVAMALRPFQPRAPLPLYGVPSALGLGLICYAVFAFTSTTPFPAPYALVPALGTALVIYGESAAPSWVGKMLSERVPVAIGLVSYALYLWHWPVLVFGRLLRGRPLGSADLLIALSLTAALAVGSRYLLEEPVRRRVRLHTRDAVYGFAGGAMILACAAAFATVKTAGFPERVPARALAFTQDIDKPTTTFQRACADKLLGTKNGQKGVKSSWVGCELGSEEQDMRPSFVFWGDSHAAALSASVARAAKELHLRGTIVWKAGCVPGLGVWRVGHPPARCQGGADAVERLLTESDSYRTVVIAARWGYYINGLLEDEAAWFGLQDRYGQSVDSAGSVRVLERGLVRLLDQLGKRKLKVIMVGPVPEVAVHVPSTLARSAWLHRPMDIRLPFTEHLAWQEPVLDMLDRLQQRYGFATVFPHDALCKQGRCELEHAGKALYSDDNHVLTHAASLLAPVFARALGAAAGISAR